ncbi:hypothetical protein V6N11_022389 [Hibiscus sabdariffa]|uniref:Uncharacterized protein n=1 Tax=Hibiscus sabdariffa TaxID=183260 RepID=A0ABR2TJY9_9ROSI
MIITKTPQQSKPKSSRNLRVSFASSSEMQVCVPKRISSSAFGAEPATPMEWSATSNESLFSIHINNSSSYSKDQFFMLYKSGELTKLDEQIIAQKNSLPSLKELDDMAARDEDIDTGSGNATDDSEPKVAQAKEVQSSDSNGQIVGNISISFTFPVLTGADGGRLSSACADQNKGFPAQQQPPQKEEEKHQQQKEITGEMEA